jgi:exosortase A-associated hydrolase 1
VTPWRERPLLFPCEGAQLVGVLHEPSMPHADHGVVIVVGGPQTRVGSHRQFVLMARDLAAAGYPVLRFDYRGMGDSAGAARNFEGVDADLAAAVDALLRSVPSLRGVVLWGLCDAASACFMHASADTRVVGMIVANPWVHTEAGAATAYIKHYYGQRLLQRAFWAKVFTGKFDLIGSARDFAGKLLRTVAGKQSAPGPKSFIERMRDGLQRFSRPVLVLMSENDLTAQEFRGLCGSNAEWARLMRRTNVESVDLVGADHTFSSRQSLHAATAQSLRWLREHAPSSVARQRTA